MTSETFRSLYQRYNNRVRNSMTAFVKNPTVAEEVTASAFAAAFKNLPKFRGDSSFYTWVHAIAVNEARSYLRKRKPESLDALEVYETAGVWEQDVLDQAVDRSECRERIRRCLRRIPRVYRRTLIDHYIRGCPTNRIARAHRVPQGTVLSRMFKAKRLLREAWAS
jgi:RNA polymerase sigma-70 factor (ECF subfamily)